MTSRLLYVCVAIIQYGSVYHVPTCVVLATSEDDAKAQALRELTTTYPEFGTPQEIKAAVVDPTLIEQYLKEMQSYA